MTKQAKQYRGSVYIGAVGPETDVAACRDSIERIQRRPGDEGPFFVRATKGFEARQMHLDKFINSRHDFILLLDSDMVFAPDTLERLRAHGLPFVTGLYMRRQYAPVAPVWFRPFKRQWPYEPFTANPSRDKLHELGASGWGCILLHREVITETRKILKGEKDIIEDDMDLWPYDIQQIMHALHGLTEISQGDGHVDKLLVRTYLKILREEIRPLRGVKTNIGSDIRFPFYARAAGYKLMGDANVRPAHMLNYPLSPDDYDGMAPEYYSNMEKNTRKMIQAERKAINAALEGLS